MDLLELISAPQQTEFSGLLLVDVEERLQADVDRVRVQDGSVDVESQDVLSAAAEHVSSFSVSE